MPAYCFDQTDDYSWLDLTAILKTAGTNLPAYVKSAEIDDKSTVEALSKEAFADPEHRAYPVNTPARVWLSSAYFNRSGERYANTFGKTAADKVAATIQSRARLFNIENDLDSSKEPISKSAGYEDQYLVTVKTAGADLDLFLVRHKQDFEKAAEVFSGNLEKYPFHWRQPIARAFVKRASDFEVDDLPVEIFKYAGMYYYDPAAVAGELKRRAGHDKTGVIAKLAEHTDGLGDCDMMFKVAETVYRVEKQAGRYAKKDGRFPDPVLTFFSRAPEKVASVLSDTVKIAGDWYSMDALSKVPQDIYEQAFGIKIAFDDAENARTVLETMPASDMAFFQELSGIKPAGA